MTITLSNEQAQTIVDALCEYIRHETNDARKHGVSEDSDDVVCARQVGTMILQQLKQTH